MNSLSLLHRWMITTRTPGRSIHDACGGLCAWFGRQRWRVWLRVIVRVEKERTGSTEFLSKTTERDGRLNGS